MNSHIDDFEERNFAFGKEPGIEVEEEPGIEVGEELEVVDCKKFQHSEADYQN